MERGCNGKMIRKQILSFSKQKLHLLLAPDNDKTVFPHVPVVGFRNGKSLKD